MLIKITAYLTNGDKVESQDVNTEKEAADAEVTHDQFLHTMAQVIDAYENVSKLSKFTLVDSQGDTLSINPGHVLYVRISGWDSDEAEAAEKRLSESRMAQRTARRGY